MKYRFAAMMMGLCAALAVYASTTAPTIEPVSRPTVEVEMPRQFYGLLFDGVNDYAWAAHSTSLNITTAITVECWAWASSTANGALIAKYEVTGDKRCWQLYASTGALVSADVSADGGLTNFKRYRTSSAVWNSTWHHVAFTFAANSLILYVDGTVMGLTKTSDGTVNSIASKTDVPVDVGANGITPGFFITGRVAQLRIWNVVRTQAQIQATMYTPFLGPTTGLVLEYPMVPGSGQSLTDWSGTGNTGTLGATTGESTDDPVWVGPDHKLPPTKF